MLQLIVVNLTDSVWKNPFVEMFVVFIIHSGACYNERCYNEQFLPIK